MTTALTTATKTLPPSRVAYRRILLRVGRLLGVLFAAMVLVFLAVEALPGDAATQTLGPLATETTLAQYRSEMGLDQSPVTRFFAWGAGVLQGDFGAVIATGQPVAEAIAGPLQNSLLLIAVASVGIVVCGLGGGTWAGLHQNQRSDKTITTAALVVLSVPEFITATIIVVVFSTWLHWFPAVSLIPPGSTMAANPLLLALPALSITVMASAMLVRQVRAVVAKAASAPHVEAAELSGLSPARVAHSHILPTARGPILQAAGAIVPYLIGGTVVTEKVFGYPGLGSLLVNAVTVREPNLVLACSFLIVLAVGFGFLLADLIGEATNGKG